MGNKFHNLTYCSSLQPVVVYNLNEIESTFPLPLWDYVANCWWLCGMVSICLIKKGKYDLFFHEGLLLDWLIFPLFLLQSVCCSKYSAKKTNFSILNLFLHFLLHPFVLKHFRIFVTAMRSKFHCLLAKVFHEVNLEGNLLILSCGVLLAWFSMLEINSI